MQESQKKFSKAKTICIKHALPRRKYERAYDSMMTATMAKCPSEGERVRSQEKGHEMKGSHRLSSCRVGSGRDNP